MSHITRLTLFTLLACTSILLLSCGGAEDGAGSSGNVAQIFNDNCVNCHNNNSVGTFSMALDENGKQNSETYKDLIKATVLDKSMPPWLVDGSGSCNTFENDLSMSNSEIAAVVNWADAGGSTSSLGSATPPPALPTLDRVDLTATMPVNYDLPPYDTTGLVTEVSRCFVVDPIFTTPPTDNSLDYLVTAFEVHPGTPKIVHHVVLYGITTTSAEGQVSNIDPSGLGYECFGGSGLATAVSPILASWTPGNGAINYPDGTGLKLDLKQDGTPFKMIMQVHYDASLPSIRSDQSTIKFTLEAVDPSATNNVVTKASIIPFEKTPFFTLLPAGQADTAVNYEDLLNQPTAVDVLGVFPHMHSRGTRLNLKRIDTSNRETCLLDVPRWGFEWQRFFFYSYSKPAITIATNDLLTLSCHYNTTNETFPISDGQSASEEMCAVYLYVVPS